MALISDKELKNLTEEQKKKVHNEYVKTRSRSKKSDPEDSKKIKEAVKKAMYEAEGGVIARIIAGKKAYTKAQKDQRLSTGKTAGGDFLRGFSKGLDIPIASPLFSGMGSAFDLLFGEKKPSEKTAGKPEKVSGNLSQTKRYLSTLNQIQKDVAFIRDRISTKTITAKAGGKGNLLVSYDPLAPEGEKFRQVTASGTLKVPKEYQNSAIMQAATYAIKEYKKEQEREKYRFTDPKEKSAFDKDIQEQLAESADDPISLLRKDMDKNFKKVFDLLEGRTSAGGGLGVLRGIKMIMDAIKLLPFARIFTMLAPMAGAILATGAMLKTVQKIANHIFASNKAKMDEIEQKYGLKRTYNEAGEETGFELPTGEFVEREEDLPQVYRDIIATEGPTARPGQVKLDAARMEAIRKAAETRTFVDDRPNKQSWDELDRSIYQWTEARKNSVADFNAFQDMYFRRFDQLKAIADKSSAVPAAPSLDVFLSEFPPPPTNIPEPDISAPEVEAVAPKLGKVAKEPRVSRPPRASRKAAAPSAPKSGFVPPTEGNLVYEDRLKNLSDLIASQESGGNYNAYNRGKAGDSTNAPQDLSQVSIAEYLRRSQKDSNDPEMLFAVGKYQIIPDTMRNAVAALKLDSASTYLTPEIQEMIFREYLIKIKRKSVYDYLTGKSDNLNKALLDLSKEWASLGVPYNVDVRNKEGQVVRRVRKGQSYYSGVGGNVARVSAEKIAQVINAPAATLASLRPERRVTGGNVLDQTSALDRERRLMNVETKPAVVAPIINNNNVVNKQTVGDQKISSTRNNENSFSRSLASDFSHPTSFNSVYVG